jgi:alanine racemase
MPAKAGIHSSTAHAAAMDSCFRGNDGRNTGTVKPTAIAGDDRPLLTIDLAAIVANYRQLAALAAPAEAAPAVKADAYGLGMAEVARALAGAGARTFFVATLEEGRALRALLPAAVIYVLNGLPAGGAATMLAERLRPCLKSLADVAGWAEAGAPAALHIDTGINRLGLGPDEVARLVADPSALARIDVALVMSHLACGENPDAATNARQLAEFGAAAERLGLAGQPRSIAGSAGIFLGRPYHLALVRPGAAIYGLAVLNDRPNPMRQAVRLEGRILQVRRVDRGMGVGYGATHLVQGPGRIATVGIGYADGLTRALGNRGFAVLGDRRVPVVGRVSMDLMTLDVSAAPPDLAVPGAMVELIGPRHSVDELAAEAGTVGYEILAGLGRRLRRVYLPAAEPGR